MQFEVNVVALGVRGVDVTMEGKRYNYTEVYLEEPFAKDNESAKGSAVITYRWGESDNFQAIKHNPFPMQAKAIMEVVPDGKGGQRTAMKSLLPINGGKPGQVVSSGAQGAQKA
jgi:hypothetical protein